MFNLRGIANAAIVTVNPNIRVTWRQSTGFGKGAGQRQIPTYNDVPDVEAQLQALDGKEQELIDKLNIQGTVQAIYLYPIVSGVQRPRAKGGDLIVLPNGEPWLVVKVLETWADWSKAAIVLQDS